MSRINILSGKNKCAWTTMETYNSITYNYFFILRLTSSCSWFGSFLVTVTGWTMFLQSSPLPFSAEAPLLRIWMARRMSRLKRATAAALSHSHSCSRDFRKGSTSMSGPRLIQPHSCRARLRSSLWYRSTSVCLSEPDQQRRVSVVPERETFL